MKLALAFYGDPILRKKCVPVENIDDDLRKLVEDMKETMEANNGIGLAAPQVNKSITLFIMSVPEEGPDDSWIPGKFWVFINPKIISYSEETWACSEGCLSIPKVYGDVLRPLKVTVEATNLDGERFTAEFTHLEAHVILHENDHLNGVLFIDRIRGRERDKMDPKLRDIKKKYSKKS